MSINNRLKRFDPVIFLGLITVLSAPVYGVNEAMLDLLDILKDKGSLTNPEYELLRNAALADREAIDGKANEAKQEINTAREELAMTAKDLDWANQIKLKGDMRLRWQLPEEDGKSSARERGRLR